MVPWGLGCVILYLCVVLVGSPNSIYLAPEFCWKVKGGCAHMPGILAGRAGNLVLGVTLNAHVVSVFSTLPYSRAAEFHKWGLSCKSPRQSWWFCLFYLSKLSQGQRQRKQTVSKWRSCQRICGHFDHHIHLS